MERLHPDSEKLIQEATDDKTSPDRLNELAKIGQTLARLVAANPNADPELLAKLASSDDREIRRAVAANPNAPTKTLWKVGEEFPDEVLDNPVFSLLLLENPNLIETLREDTLVSFLMCSTVPVSFLDLAAVRGTEDLKLALTINPQTPKRILEKLVISRNPWLREAARLHVNFIETIPEDLKEVIDDPTKAILMENSSFDIGKENWEFLVEIGIIPFVFLDRLAIHKESNLRGGVASSYLASDRLLEKLAKDVNIQVRAAVAKNPRAPVKVLEQLAKDGNLGVRLGVAENPSTPACILEELGNERSIDLRKTVGNNPNTPATVLESLAKDRRKGVRARVAKNPSTPVYVLEKLAIDAELALAVASNINAPPYLLEQIALSKLGNSQQLRKSLAINPNTPSHLLEKLALDEEASVRKQVARNPSTPTKVLEELARPRSDELWDGVTRNVEIVMKILEKQKENRFIRSSIALNPNTSLDTLEKLSRDPNPEVHLLVASNPNTPVRILEEIGRGYKTIQHSEPNFLEMLVSSVVPPELFFQEDIVKRFLTENPEGFSVLLELFTRDREIFSPSNLFVFSHSQMPAKVLAQNCRSLAWLERCAIARNPNTPTDALQILARDGNRIVRAAARASLGDRVQA